MVQSILKRLFDPRGRIGRSEMLLLATLLILLEFVTHVIEFQAGQDAVAVIFMLKCLMVTIAISATIKRLHDMGYSGWWLLGGAAILCMWTAIIALSGLLLMGRDVLLPGSSGHMAILGLVMLPAIAMTLWLHVSEGHLYKNEYGTPITIAFTSKSTPLGNNSPPAQTQTNNDSSVPAV